MSNNYFGISGKGYYIALVLCAAAIGITGYLYYANVNKVQEVSVQEPSVELETTLGTREESVPPASKPAAVPAPSGAGSEPTESAPPRILRTAAPVAGETIGEYAMQNLSYNETTRDWRVHNGIDLSAEEGTEVCAAADGTVYSTYEDEMMGYTVVIRHEGGYTTRYSNLSQTLLVHAGDRVTLGQPLGYVGCSALLESALPAHVHFSVTCQDAAMAPEDFFELG